jgi:hypothetical protein
MTAVLDKCLPSVKSIFDTVVLNFLEALSRKILNDKDVRAYPDILTLGFWCRRNSLELLKKDYEDNCLSLGRGLVFHIAPSNVPTMFAYSLICGLLSGNKNIVRVPSGQYPQVDYICAALDELLQYPEFSELQSFICCIQYDHHTSDHTTVLSEKCDIRVIWGGDQTIHNIRKIPISAASYDIVFPDRYSACIIDSDAWINCNQKERQLKYFYNDTYLSDQLACSSPTLVLWTGSQVGEARFDFWSRLEALLQNNYSLQSIQSIGKLEAACRISGDFPGVRICSDNNYIVRIWTDKVAANMLEECPGQGFFIESDGNEITSISNILGSRFQTLSYLGISTKQLSALLASSLPRGIQRIVPIGQTMDFSLVWDGYDIIRMMSRRINII